MAQVIFNADDYGFSRGTNRAIGLAATEGRLTSLTVMATHPGAKEITGLVKRLPTSFSIGLHVNLTEGKPLRPATEVSSLVNSHGAFFGPNEFVPRLLGGLISFKHLNLEIRAQAELMRRMLGTFSHFDSHHHIHRFSLVLKSIIEVSRSILGPRIIRTNNRYLASSASISTNRCSLWLHHLKAHPFALPGLILKMQQRYLFSRAQFCSPDFLLTPVPGIPFTDLDVAMAKWGRVFESLPEGIYELNFHPGRFPGDEEVLRAPDFGRLLQKLSAVSFHAVGGRRGAG